MSDVTHVASHHLPAGATPDLRHGPGHTTVYLTHGDSCGALFFPSLDELLTWASSLVDQLEAAMLGRECCQSVAGGLHASDCDARDADPTGEDAADARREAS